MNRERLQHLITILAAVPPERLYMRRWVCGTSACALGWAAMDPEFNAQGLMLETVCEDSSIRHPVCKGVTLLDSTGFRAATHFFGISRADTEALFEPSTYNTEDIQPAHVIARIGELLLRDAREADELAAQLEDIDHARSQL